MKIPGTFEATIKIAFGDVSNVFFSFNECQSSAVDNSLELQKKIIELHNENEWDKDYYIVTGLLAASNSTVILADNNKSEIVFEVDAPLVASIPIAQLKDEFLNGKISFNDTFSSNISLKIIAKESLIPLIKLSKLKEGFFSGKQTLDSSIDTGIGDAIGINFSIESVESENTEDTNEICLKLEEVDVMDI